MNEPIIQPKPPPPALLLALLATDSGLKVANAISYAIYGTPAPKGSR